MRKEVRLSQVELSKLAGLSRETVNLIEREMTRPKVDTLRRLADGLATNGAGARNPDQADAYYDRLMRSAGYTKGESAPPAEAGYPSTRAVEDLTDEEVEDLLERYSADPKAAVAFLSTVKRWQDMSPSARRFVLFSLEEARRMDEELEAAERANRSRRRAR